MVFGSGRQDLFFQSRVAWINTWTYVCVLWIHFLPLFLIMIFRLMSGLIRNFLVCCKCYSRITYSEIKSMTPSFLISSGNEMEHYDFCRKKMVIHTYIIWDEIKMKNRQWEWQWNIFPARSFFHIQFRQHGFLGFNDLHLPTSLMILLHQWRKFA